MHLKKAAWGEGSDPSSPVGALVSSLTTQRLYREVNLALRTGLRDAKADFSFLRLRGLRQILKFLQSVAGSEATIRLFQESQSVPELQRFSIIDGLGLCCANPPRTSYFYANLLAASSNKLLVNATLVEPMQITSPPTDCEVSLALRVLEGCCLLHKESAALAHQHRAVKVLINILCTGGVLEQGACLDALISIMIDSSANQMDFEVCCGIEKVAKLIKDEQVDEKIRLRCGEFFLLLIGHVSGREKPPLESIQEDVRHLLGEKCASLIWAASHFGSTLDPEQRQTALQIQARRVLESLELH